MAPLLTINGVEVLCTASEWEPVTLGEVVRSLNGWPRNTSTVRKRDYRFTSSFLSLPAAESLRGLVEGDGHRWNFEGSAAGGYLFSSRELGPTTTSGSVARGTISKYGANGLWLSTVGSTVTWAAALGPAWTVAVWRSPNGTGVFTHYVVRSDGAKWVNGARSDATATPFLTVVSGNLTLTATVGNTDFDELVVLPYAVLDEWPPLLFAFNSTTPWPALPLVRAAGERLPTGGLECIGKAGAGKTMPRLSISGEMFDFILYGT